MKERLSTTKAFTTNWEIWVRGACLAADFQGSAGKISAKVQAVERALLDLVEFGDNEISKARQLAGIYTDWLRWYRAPPGDPIRKDPLSLCQWHNEPTVARDFLVCPPLSGVKCARLFGKIDKPENAYEAFVSRRPLSQQDGIMKMESYGPVEMYYYRLGIITGFGSRNLVKKYIDWAESLRLPLIDSAKCSFSGIGHDEVRKILASISACNH